jgi:hypothetical protein
VQFIKYLWVITLLLTLQINTYSQSLWTIGPMLHVNFGGEKRSTSFGIETAYWNINATPWSIDFGVEFDRRKTRLYSEVQTGIGLTGISLGPVLQFNTGGGTKLGVQGSCWINYGLGVDYRMRFLRDEKIHSVGVYAKILMASSGLPSGSSHWSHWERWDD